MSGQATKALLLLNSLFEAVSLDITEKLKLFDTMVLPISNYWGDVRSFQPGPDAGIIRLTFMKTLLGIRPQTTEWGAVVYGELGRVPLSILRKERMLKYWFKIMKAEGSLTFTEAFKYQLDHDTNAVLWADQVKRYYMN